jgi:hypothetical protein
MGFEQIRLIVEIVVAILVTPFAYVLWGNFKAVKAMAEKTKDDLADYKLHAAETYSTKNDLGKAIEQFSRSIDAVFAKLERIEDKLDSKADKANK